MVTAYTMSFYGVLNLFLYLGFVVDFERHGYEKGASMLFLRKDL